MERTVATWPNFRLRCAIIWPIQATCWSHLDLSDPLTDRQNVSLGIPEPRRFCASAGGNTVYGLETWSVIFLKGHASGFELGDFGFDIINGPECCTCLRCTRARRRIHEYP